MNNKTKSIRVMQAQGSAFVHLDTDFLNANGYNTTNLNPNGFLVLSAEKFKSLMSIFFKRRAI